MCDNLLKNTEVFKFSAASIVQDKPCSWFPNLKGTWKAKWSFLFLADASATIKWGFMSHQMARNSGPGQELSLRTKLSKERSKRIDEVRGRLLLQLNGVQLLIVIRAATSS